MPESLEEHIAMMAKEGSGFVGALNAQQKAVSTISYGRLLLH
jgi:hypothetical protein